MPAAIPESMDALRVPVDSLEPYFRNPRRGDVPEIVRSLRRLGQYRPVVVNRGTSTGRENEVLAGNHTLEAARALGWTEIAATFVDVDDDTAARIVAVDNRSSDLATYDDEVLGELLASISDLEGTGYSPQDLNELLAVGAQTPGKDTDPKAKPKKAKAKPGDIYLLGEHRLLCGDATDQGEVDRLLERDIVDLVVTDPPYGVGYVGGTSDAMTIENDALTPEATRDLFADALRCSHIRPGGVFYATVPPGDMLRWFLEAPDLALGAGAVRQVLIWVKDRFVLGRADYHGRAEGILHGHRPGEQPVFDPSQPFDEAHEHITYGWKPGASHEFYGGRKQDTVWEFDRPAASRAHPTMKPTALFERMVDNSSRVTDVVYDPFGGSGTTLIACENLKRRARLVELDPAYADVIVDRWERHTGQKAERRR